MKLNLLGFTLFLCFEELLALSPANINKVQHFDNGNHQFIRRNVDQDTKPFNVTHMCFGDQCKKVSETFDKLTNTLASIIQVKNQIKIDVVFASYCEKRKLCNLTDKIGFGDGHPNRYYTIKNKDGKDIHYPSALHKQLVDPSKNDKPMNKVFSDITLSFNSDDKYWFEGDEDIKAGQPNFVIAAAKNLIRGLGVDFSIGESGIYEFSHNPKFSNDTKFSNETIFIPGYTIESGDSDQDVVTSLKFNRYILDTLVITTSDGKSINNLLDPYVDFAFPNHTIPSNEIMSYLKKTPINEASEKFAKLFNTPDSLAIKLPSGNSLAFETSIKVNETSYNGLYFNESKYLNTKDALLTAKVTKSESRLPSEKTEDWPTYPFGPVLIETLEYMGYTLKDSYKKSVTSEPKKDGKSGNDSSSIKANLGLLAAIASLYLLS